MSDAQLELSRFVAPSRDCGSFRGDALRRLVPLTRRKWIQHDGRSWRSGRPSGGKHSHVSALTSTGSTCTCWRGVRDPTSEAPQSARQQSPPCCGRYAKKTWPPISSAHRRRDRSASALPRSTTRAVNPSSAPQKSAVATPHASKRHAHPWRARRTNCMRTGHDREARRRRRGSNARPADEAQRFRHGHVPRRARRGGDAARRRGRARGRDPRRGPRVRSAARKTHPFETHTIRDGSRRRRGARRGHSEGD